jgi:hypothetical protein
MKPNEIRIPKYWSFPAPKSNYTMDSYNDATNTRVAQQKFYDEYYPSGHQIFNPAIYPDIPIMDEKEKITGYHYVNRISLPFQCESVDIVLAHLLGNKTQFKDSTVGENKSEILSQYKEFWDTKNIDTLRNDLIKSILAVGDGAVLFYRDTELKEFKWKVLSFLDGEEIYEHKDKYGELDYFGRFYSLINEDGTTTEYCEILDKKSSTIFKNTESGWVVFESGLHGFKEIPVVYYKRKAGAFWTPVQNNIHNLEVMYSRLSEDNRTKAKARYHLKTDNPDQVQTTSAGTTDIVITDATGDFKLISGADISTQFKFEWETSLEIISNKLGMVFPKSKSSGDMPTGSMKMMFYPTERIVFQLINEFNAILDKVNRVVKEGIMFEMPVLASDIAGMKITAYIKMFSPQDDGSVMTSLGQAKQYGTLSTQTVAENMPYAANDEVKRLEEEAQKAAEELAKQEAAMALESPEQTNNE